MAVGFDIDDTLLFSSPGFYRGKQEFSPNDESYLKNPAFWEKMNNGWDAFSMPKEVGKALIAMHLKRGDHIYFVTGRSATKTETVSQTLQQTMNIPADQLNPVIFAGDQPGQNTKVQWLKDKQMKLFYGDADGDIKAAQEVGIRGIRLLRAANSSYRPLPLAGALGKRWSSTPSSDPERIHATRAGPLAPALVASVIQLGSLVCPRHLGRLSRNSP